MGNPELSPSLLEPLVAVVATLGELAATVAGPCGDIQLAVSPGSLHRALETFAGHLRDTLGHPGATSLGRALATPGATRAELLAEATSWRGSVAALGDSWARLAREATELRDACRDAATAGDSATGRAGDLQAKATRWGTAGDNLVATARRLPVALSEDSADKAVAKHATRLAEATEELATAREDYEVAIVASSQAGAMARRARRAALAAEPLGRLVAACDKATCLPRELLRRLGDIAATLQGARQVTRGVPEAAVAAVAEAERLWEASARLARRHLRGTLGDIRELLYTAPGDLGGPSGHSVAERCQKAIEDIPRLLRGQ